MKIALVHPANMDYRKELFEMMNNEYDITFIFTKQGRGQDNVKENQEPIPNKWKYKILKSDYLFAGKDILMYIRLTAELLFGKYDIVITSTSRYICWITTIFSGSKFIFMNEFWYFEDSSFTRKILNSFTKYIVKNSDFVISMGTETYQNSLRWGVEKNKMIMYPQCAVDYSKLYATDTEKIKILYRLKNKKIIFFLGRHVEGKGIEYLIKSFISLESKNENLFLIIGGDGPLKEKYELLAKNSKIKNILFTGQLNANEKSIFYEICDIFVLPSVFNGPYYEPWGLVINEAMAFGKLIITTNAVGASADLVKDGYNGYVVKEKNSKELCEAIEKVLLGNNIELMGRRSREIFECLNNYNKMFKAFKYAINTVAK
ncbi:glycosyltransferase family 4 protein [Methanosarcina mazei]|uniref:Glycosyltransferase n=1 Tax=Methanosarcina mazei LYC TaxID=1434114 RepID=A0A0E3LWN5_METMZ|nr:glycosyltransferase family 4 protein [Methanosarcina mazei]AKB69081.1 Glycosyltransferase [Methanosarcina mazei LYC]